MKLLLVFYYFLLGKHCLEARSATAFVASCIPKLYANIYALVTGKRDEILLVKRLYSTFEFIRSNITEVKVAKNDK